jgi:quinone-modifying oxidoreductase subunit QmoC
MLALTMSMIAAFGGGVRYWRAMNRQAGPGGAVSVRRVGRTLLLILRHRKFAECRTEPAGTRVTHKEHLPSGHRLVFYGFLGLLVTTTSVGIGIYAFGYLTPWPLWHPVKLLGNASGLAVMAAALIFGYRRAVDREPAGRNAYPDWLFLAILFLTALTGFMSEWLRVGGVREMAYPMYFVHLVAIFFLLVYFPYSKFAHLVYRTVAMVHASDAGRDGPVRSRALILEDGAH